MGALNDANTSMQIIGCLIANPSFLSDGRVEIDERADFIEKLHRLAYGAIYNLYIAGATKITPVDIDNVLSSFEANYQYFKAKNGLQFLNDAEDFAQPDNFWIYYDRFKKLSALRSLKAMGHDISFIYDENIIDTKKEIEMEEAFSALSLSDIFNRVKERVEKIERKYRVNISDRSVRAHEGIDELINGFKNGPEVGYPFANDIMTTILRGQRKGRLYLSSSGTSGGKTRAQVGEACHIVYPFKYLSDRGKWVKTGYTSKKVLFILTEMEPSEIITMIPAYLADVNEEQILQGLCMGEEARRINIAKEIMKKYPFFFIEQMPNPNVEALQSIIRYYVQVHQVEYVFYDYIFSSTGLLNEFRDLRVREDVSLLLMANGLKEIATTYNIYVRTSTQLNAEGTNPREEKTFYIRNQNFLRGSKAVADKADVGYITLPVTEEERKRIQPMVEAVGLPMPTHVSDIYKNRRGRHTYIKVWHLFDLGTCRMQDLFVTDGHLNPYSIDVVKYGFEDEEEVEMTGEEMKSWLEQKN